MEAFVNNQPGLVVIRRGRPLKKRAAKIRMIQGDIVRNRSNTTALVALPSTESYFDLAPGVDCVWEKDADGTWGFCVTSGKVTYRGTVASSGLRRYRLRSRGGRAGSFGSTYSVEYQPGWTGKSIVWADAQTGDLVWQTYGSNALQPVPAGTTQTFSDPARVVECSVTMRKRSASAQPPVEIYVDDHVEVRNPNGAVLGKGWRVLIPGAVVTVGDKPATYSVIPISGISVLPLAGTKFQYLQAPEPGDDYRTFFLEHGTLNFASTLGAAPVTIKSRRRGWLRSRGGAARTFGTRYVMARTAGVPSTTLTVSEGTVDWESRSGATTTLCDSNTPQCPSSKAFPD